MIELLERARAAVPGCRATASFDLPDGVMLSCVGLEHGEFRAVAAAAADLLETHNDALAVLSAADDATRELVVCTDEHVFVFVRGLRRQRAFCFVCEVDCNVALVVARARHVVDQADGLRRARRREL